MAAFEGQLKVTGAAVVLRTESGADKYLYRGAVVSVKEFAEVSVKHALTIGLVEKVAVAKAAPAAAAKVAAEKAAAEKAEGEKVAAAAAADSAKAAGSAK